ncbi:MAG: SpoIIE family protein phosphatase [Treponema sp.]|jgi:serine phosphatase RsbU (regulator of sigma subunit)|nr:SpoIIE family protein phosphatase [Treponema sp.]
MRRRVLSGFLISLSFFVLLFPAPHAQEGFYWDHPAVFSEIPGKFPVSASRGDFSAIAWQESSPAAGGGEIRISLAAGAGTWRTFRSVGGPYHYTGNEPAILSIALDRAGRIIIAVAASPGECEILVSEDRGQSFSRRLIDGGSSSVAPRISIRSDGGYLIFITRGTEQSLSLYYALSEDALNWGPFTRFVENPALPLSFLPAHAALGSSEFVVFQSLTADGNSPPSFQLFIKRSDDGGRTWGPSRLLTDFQERGREAPLYDNQRPSLVSFGNRLFLVWERRYQANSPQIYGVELREDGTPAAPPQQINQNESYCNDPVAFTYRGEPMAAWFDNRNGTNRAYLGRRDGVFWINQDLSGPGDDMAFVRPAAAGGLSFFYQSNSRGGSRIYSIFPDRFTPVPAIGALNFRPGIRSREGKVRLNWTEPRDPSGIAGYSWLWSREAGEEPERNLRGRSSSLEVQTLELQAEDEGPWYFSLIAQDLAGNWSGPGRMEYIRDTTAPPAVTILPPQTDTGGFLLSNTFSLRWLPAGAPDVAVYVKTLRYLGPLDPSSGGGEAFEAPQAPPSPELSASYENLDNGLWEFSVSAVDQAGNTGPPSELRFKTDKYIPRTRIALVDVRNEQGVPVLHIQGRGFALDGAISRIFLDQDGEAPFDREYFFSSGDYQVPSDREITGLRIDGVEQGQYRLGLEHPLRGIVLAEEPLTLETVGTAASGSRTWTPSWRLRAGRPVVIDPAALLMAAVLIFCLAGIFVTLRGICRVITDSRAARTEVLALLRGDFMPIEKRKHLTAVKRQGLGLRFKLAAFTIVLVLLVVTMVSVPLYYMMTRTQEATLLQSLRNRSRVLLDGLASNVRAYLPEKNILQLGFLPNQIAAIPEARYVTITGYGEGETVFNDHVWATNDPDILTKIDTEEFRPGVSRLSDILSPRLEGISRELNYAARERVGDLSLAISDLNAEGLSISTSLDAESRRRFADIQVSVRSLETRLTEGLAEIGREIGSEPAFSTDRMARQGECFIFFKPVLYRQGREDVYFRGLIRLEVSLDSIREQIARDQISLLRIILLVALAALTMGTFGALALSSVIIRPITRLVSHVERIRDTDDKSKLAGLEINISTQDEIAVLGTTINDMTHSLVKAAIAASDLSIGKEVQKKFIPLELDSQGNKLSTGFKETRYAEFFGYYEGAKGVSGDYFDYQDLDGRYFAIIKCDVAGKGIPAALIMIQVATMFLNHFKQWKPDEKGMRIEELVYNINDFIETLSFKGRFAAFTLCLFDSQTGLLRLCNAGDNIVHFFDASERKMKTITLQETPATGVLPNIMVQAKSNYTVNTMNLDHGDILFLYTDGIEEAKRRFRDPEFREIACAHGPAGSPHENHLCGQEDEELGAGRVEEIINAVMNREVYTLHKWHNPEGNTDLSFDFTTCQGQVEEAIMALVSVEKIFRCYKNPKAGEDSRVLVDRKLDAFLKTHFFQYRNYCSRTRENPGNDSYMYYTHLNEDEQYDDLTILGISRKA